MSCAKESNRPKEGHTGDLLRAHTNRCAADNAVAAFGLNAGCSERYSGELASAVNGGNRGRAGAPSHLGVTSAVVLLP